MGAPRRASMARSLCSRLKERCSPRSPEKVKIPQSTPGARSSGDTAVGSHAKKKMTMPRSANTAAETKAVRVRNSIARSLRAMRSAAESVLGAMHHVLAIHGEIGGRVDRLTGLQAHERARAHDRGMRRERESVRDLVRDEHHRG